MAFRFFDFSAARRTLANRNFALYTAGNAVSLVGTWVQRMAVGWLTWELTNSGAWLGAVSLAEFMPVILLAPIIGALVDRFDRRMIAVTGQIFATFQALALAVLTATGHITPLLIVVLQLCSGVVQPLIQTARLVLVPSMVPRENVGHAVAITSTIFNMARVLGPALSGIIIATAGPGFTFALNAVCYLGVIAALISLRLPPHQPPSVGGPGVWRSLWSDMAEGWRYTFTHPQLKWLMPLIGVVSALTWPLGDLMAGIADTAFDRGPGGLAILISAQGVGAIIGGLFLAQRTSPKGLATIVLRAMMVSGILIAAFALTTWFWGAVILLVVNGMFSVQTGVGSQTLTQTAVDDRMRGRALSVWYTITRAGPACGALIIGSLASHFGFPAPLCAAGLISAATAAFVFLRRRRAAPPPTSAT